VRKQKGGFTGRSEIIPPYPPFIPLSLSPPPAHAKMYVRNTRDEFNRTRAPPSELNGNFSLVAHEDGIVAIVGDPYLSLSFSYKAKLKRP